MKLKNYRVWKCSKSLSLLYIFLENGCQISIKWVRQIVLIVWVILMRYKGRTLSIKNIFHIESLLIIYTNLTYAMCELIGLFLDVVKQNLSYSFISL
jgi:hypothetical protein